MEKSQPSTSGYDLYHRVLGSPKFVVAPMVDQSELAWRMLSRRYGAHLCYTPMINAKMYADEIHKTYRENNFNLRYDEEGGPQDRPLIVQFAANDPEQLLRVAQLVEAHCDAIDLNFGCPQDIARRGHYGCYLQDDWDLVYRLINILHTNLSIPVTAKFRVFASTEKTVEYAKMMERAGAQILTCHGRTREQRGHNSGLADWAKIRAVKDAVNVPVFANGNVLYHSDMQACLDATGADAIMSAEGNLYNPAIFTTSLPLSVKFTPEDLPSLIADGLFLPHTSLALEYLTIVRSLKTTTALSAVKGHLFKLMRPALGIETDLRERMGRAKGPNLLDEYETIVRELAARMKAALASGDKRYIIEDTSLKHMSPWLAQPYFRPLPSTSHLVNKIEPVEVEISMAFKEQPPRVVMVSS